MQYGLIAFGGIIVPCLWLRDGCTLLLLAVCQNTNNFFSGEFLLYTVCDCTKADWNSKNTIALIHYWRIPQSSASHSQQVHFCMETCIFMSMCPSCFSNLAVWQVFLALVLNCVTCLGTNKHCPLLKEFCHSWLLHNPLKTLASLCLVADFDQ